MVCDDCLSSLMDETEHAIGIYGIKDLTPCNHREKERAERVYNKEHHVRRERQEIEEEQKPYL